MPEGYYEFEGNLLIYDGDTVYDIDSATYYPECILDVAEYKGPIRD